MRQRVPDKGVPPTVHSLSGEKGGLETFLVQHGFIQEFRQILAERSVVLNKSEDEHRI